MSKLNKIWRRTLTLALVFMLVVNLFAGVLPTAFAATYDTPQAGDTAQVSVSTRITRSDNNEKYQMHGGAHEIRDFHFSSGNYDPELQLYCIEYGKALPNNPVYTAVNPNNSVFWNNLGYYQKQGILLTLGFGYPASSISELGVSSEYDAIAATQALIWEFATGIRIEFNQQKPSDLLYYNAYIENSPAYNAYWKILELAEEYTKKDGYNFADLLERSNFLVWQYPNCQTLMAYSLPEEPLPSWKPYGKLEVQKIDTNGRPLAGAIFVATNVEDGRKFILGPTNENGYATTENNVPMGTYTFEEKVFPYGYTDNGQTEWTVVLSESSADLTEKITVTNRRLFGSISVSKTDDNGVALKDVIFTIYESHADLEVNENAFGTMTTNEDGIATLENVPSGYVYYVVETTPQTPEYIPDGTVYSVFVTNEENVWVNNGESVINTLAPGAIGIKKADEYGQLIANVKFGVYTDAECTDFVVELTTDANGEARYGYKANAGAGESMYELRARTTYYIKELAPASDEYILDTKVYAVTVQPGRLVFANNNTSITNYLKPGAASITKHNENGQPLGGVVFGVYYDADCKYLLESIVTDENGNAYYGVDAAGNYTLDDGFTVYIRENMTKDGSYIVDSTVYPVEIKAGKLTKANNGNPVINTQKKWQLNVSKEDSITGNLNAGDAFVAGAVYGLYDKNNRLVKEYTVDVNGSFTTDVYVSDVAYYFQEISAPTGYLLDTNRYYLDEYSAPTCLNDPLTVTNITLTNTVMTGTLSINKFTEDPNAPDQFVVPEDGAVFEIYLKSSGSYEAATQLGDDRLYDRATVDEDGAAIWSNGTDASKELAYGTYIVHQVSGWENRKLADDFEVVIDADGKHLTYDLENPYIGSRFVINKKDSESKKLIVNAVAKFSIKNTATGELVKFIDPATSQETTVFETVNGVASIPMEIPYGTYEVIEVEAPAGYIAGEESVKFTVDANSNSIAIDVFNDPLMGVIEIEKNGLQFVSVTSDTSSFGSISAPKFENAFLAGAVFDIVAAEDIVTADGEIHYNKGDVVDTITTSANGSVSSDELYCGKYTLVERKAPAGYCATAGNIAVEVKNDGTNKVASIHVSVNNERAQTEIVLKKEATTWNLSETETEINREIVSIPGVGFTFGIYANEEFTATDGKKIAKNDLVAVIVTDVNGVAAYSKNLPFGKYYVKELAASDTHNYKLDPVAYVVDLSVDNIQNNKISVSVNNGKTLVNDFDRFEVVITKTDLISSEPVSGALITIKNEAGEVVYTEYTNDDGILPGIVLEPGKYSFQEIVAPEGYVLNETVFSFEVDSEGKITGTTKFTNERVPEAPTPPETGDHTNVALLTLVVLAASIALATLLIFRKKIVRS